MNGILKELLPKAQSGDAIAQEALAFAYVDQDKDYYNAVRWLEEAERNGHLSVRGAWIIGMCYDDGNGVPKNAEKAEHYYRIAADSAEDNEYVNRACYWLANGHWAGDITFGEDFAIAVYYLEKMLKNNTKKLQDGAKLDLAIIFAIAEDPIYNSERAEYYIDLVKKTVTDPEILDKVGEVEGIIAESKISHMAQSILGDATDVLRDSYS